MGLLKGILSVVGILILALVGIAAFLYFTDYTAQATVTDRGSDFAIVTPKLVPTWHYKVALDSGTARFVCKGYQVEFHVQTHDMTVKDAQGRVVYQQTHGKGVANTQAAVACGATNSGSGGLI
jgi:hypothetical protein